MFQEIYKNVHKYYHYNVFLTILQIYFSTKKSQSNLVQAKSINIFFSYKGLF